MLVRHLARPLLAEIGRTLLLLLLAILLTQGLIQWAPGPSEAEGPPGWATGLLRGDLGRDRTGRPVLEVLGPAMAITGRLALGALALGVLLSLVWALTAIRWPGFGGQLSRLPGSLLSLAPIFLLGYFLALYASRVLGRVPDGQAGWLGDPWWARTLALLAPPLILAVGDGGLAALARQWETELRRIRREPWIRGFRARGVSPFRPILRSLLAPAAAMVADRLILLLGGAVVLEAVFNLRGLGYLVWQGAIHRDVPILGSSVLVAVVVVRIASLAAGLAQLLADPRVREPQEARG